MTAGAWSFAAGMVFMLILMVCGDLLNRRLERRHERSPREARCRCSLIGHQWERSDGPYVVAVCSRKCCRGHERGIYRTGTAGRPDVSGFLHLPDRFDHR